MRSMPRAWLANWDGDPPRPFETGLRKTVIWYLQNPAWVSNIVSGAYRDWVQTHYQA